MKKFLIISAALLLALPCAFAKKPSSDLQFQLGAEGFNGWEGDGFHGGALNVSIENYNMFDIGNKYVKVGIMESFSGSFGGLTGSYADNADLRSALGLNVIVAPAVELRFFRIVSFQLMFGLDFRYECFILKDGDWRTYIDMPMLGVATSGNAKFFPDSFISPIAGFRYAWTGWGESYGRNYNDGDKESDWTNNHDPHFHSFSFNIGISLNFDNKGAGTKWK